MRNTNFQYLFIRVSYKTNKGVLIRKNKFKVFQNVSEECVGEKKDELLVN